MKTTTTLALSFALAAIGCGSSQEPMTTAAATPAPTDAGTTETGTVPSKVRTIVTRSLLPGSPANLILDATFRDQGWGKFLTLQDGSSLVQTTSRVLSQSPAGVTSPVATILDKAATAEKSHGFTSICSFLGGKGPYVARVWVTKIQPNGDPAELVDDPQVFRASITTQGLPEGKAYDLARGDAKEIAGRTWWLYEGRVDADLELGFFNLKFGKRGGGFMVSAPEVVPVALTTDAGSKALVLPNLPRAMDEGERAAVAAYVRQPIQLGLPRPPHVVPGVHHPPSF